MEKHHNENKEHREGVFFEGIYEVISQIDKLDEIVRQIEESEDSVLAKPALVEISELACRAKKAAFRLALFEKASSSGKV